jgi:uncharacterized membrane protein
MISRLREYSIRSVLGLITLVPIILVLCLLLFAPPDGNERAQFLQFLGRFHPLSVHLPIALLMVVPLFELAGRSRYFPYLLPSADLLLGLAACGAIAAAMLGWSLARAGGYSGPLVTQHMWGGVFVAAAAWSCWMLRAKASTIGYLRLYAVTLVATVGIVSFTGYRGGQLSQGENHLTEFMPAPLAALIGANSADSLPTNSPNGAPGTFYGARIQPVFAQHCITCHGRNKHKAALRLDNFESLMRGGKHGAVIKAGDPKGSELFHRITLPVSDDDFMPPDNRRPVSASDVKRIELWITAGASGTQAVDAIKDIPANSASQPAVEVAFTEIDDAVVAKKRADLASAVAQLQKKFPNIVDYQSRGSDDIVINASWKGSKFGDAELAAFAPLSERIVVADLSSTSITDKSASTLAAMKHLRTLRLMHTRVGDATVDALASLDQLEFLSLFDTAVTPSALSSLARLPKLRRVYAGETKITAAASLPPDLRDKVVF